MADREVDARGLRCPWPALRLARAARAATGGERIVLIADDPNALREVKALADEHGWTMVVEGDRIAVTIDAA